MKNEITFRQSKLISRGLVDADFSVCVFFQRFLDELEQMLLIHASRRVNVSVDLAAIVEIAMGAFLLSSFFGSAIHQFVQFEFSFQVLEFSNMVFLLFVETYSKPFVAKCFARAVRHHRHYQSLIFDEFVYIWIDEIVASRTHLHIFLGRVNL